MSEWNGKTHVDFLPTTPATQVAIVTSKPWCTGAHGSLPWWLHSWLHRLRLLRLKSPAPFQYLEYRR